MSTPHDSLRAARPASMLPELVLSIEAVLSRLAQQADETVCSRSDRTALCTRLTETAKDLRTLARACREHLKEEGLAS